MRKEIIISLYFMTSGCDYSDELAREHLQAIGYKGVSCTLDVAGSADCIAEGALHFRCVMSEAPGRRPRRVACERFYLEKPAPSP